jgi:Leucine-rich repeat (LRR) protein
MGGGNVNQLAAPSTPRPRNRNWLRFSLRMLFLLTLTVAVALGVMMKRLRDRKAAVAAIEAAGGSMGLRIAGPKWLRTIINDDKCFYEPIRVSLGRIARQRGQDEPTLDDASLARLGSVLKGFKRLEILDIRGSSITDESAELLGSLETLAHLRLSDTQITNQTIREISRLRGLQSLELRGTAITDECIDNLCGFGTLTGLDIAKTQITADGVSRLKQQLPSCKITN